MSFRQLMVPDIDFIAITSSLKSAGVWLAGIVSIENDTGAIRTLLSGRNFKKDQKELATTGSQS